jgi:PKD repeat protein
MQTWLRAFSLPLILVLASCGGGGSGGGGGGGGSTPPTANFSIACTDLVCNFTNLSTTQDSNDSIIAYNWTFGDNSAMVTTTDASHTFAAASTYTVTLVAIDSKGLRGTAVRQVTVTTPAAGAAPHASFSASCLSFACTFTDTSTFDAGSVFQSRVWAFGDTVTLAATNPATHTYAAVNQLTNYTVTLTVTDTNGKTSTATQTIPVAPPATSANCVSSNCTITLTQAARVTVTLVSHSCSAHHDTVQLTAPVAQTLFTDGCYDPAGTVVSLGAGTLYPANTQLQFSVLSGTLPTSTIAFNPAIRITGDFASGWTLTFDDGYGGPAEPDFNDVVLFVKATP